jgi:hypothetical protein
MGDFLKWKRQFEEEKQSNLNSLMTPCMSATTVQSSLSATNRLTIIGAVASSAQTQYAVDVADTGMAGGTGE